MKQFMQTHKVYLTPLSPIHIGCGEDFEPTNYVIEGETLFNFEPSHLMLNERERNDLLNRINRDLRAIHQFFSNNKSKIIPLSHYFSAIPKGFVSEYNRNIENPAQKEKNGNEVFNQLQIERTAYLSYQGLPFIPGSSFKGAFITPVLSQRHMDNGRNPLIKREKKTLKKELGLISQRINEDYLYNINNLKSFDEVKEKFAHNEFRSIKFSDFSPLNSVQTKIFYCLNFNRELKNGEKTFNTKIVQRRETILPGQYRAFSANLSVLDDKVNKLLSLNEYLTISNSYYKKIFIEEMDDLVAKGFVSQTYLNNILNIINKGGFLIRLGKNGSDSKVIKGKNVAQIEIKPKKNQEVYYQDKATTYWLSADSKTQKNNLFPFGWALVEIDPITENEALKTWCEAQPKSKFDRSEILAKREAQKIEQARLQAEVEAKRLAEQKAAEEKLALLNSLSDNQRLVIDFVEKVQNTRERQADNTGSILLKEAQALIESAVENRDISERQFIKSQITVELLKSKVDFKKKDTEKNVKKWLNKLVTE